MFSHTLKNHSFFLLLLAVLILAASSAIAQDKIAQVDGANVSVTATATSDGVRFAAPSAVVQLRLEVYDGTGQKLLDTEQRGGNVLDWHLHGGNGERVADGTYLFVVTIKNLSGRLSQKLGSITVSAQSTTLRASAVTDLNAQQAQAVGPIEVGEEGLTVMPAGDAQPVTVLANNAEESQLARTRGALTFRIGDFFSGIDKEQMRLTEAGNLGIGTSEPKAKLDVAGTIRAERFLIAKPKLAGGDTLTPDSGDSVQPLATGSGTQDRIAKWIDNAGLLGNSVITETASNIGIGTTSPTSKLEVNGGFLTVGTSATNKMYVDADGTGPYLQSSGTSPLRLYSGSTEVIRILNSGNVGIGTTSPTSKLDVNGGFLTVGTSATNKIYLDADATGAYLQSNGTSPLRFYSGTTEAIRVLNSGNVGIGTGTPLAKLHIVGTQFLQSSGFNGISITAGTALQTIGSDWASGGADTPIVIKTQGGGNQLYLKTDGNVGIGMFNPQSKLDVAGDIAVSGNALISGNIAARYQDVAEWVPSRQQIAAGTVVILDVTQTNAVSPSRRAYDTLIAGVVSARPGLILGEAGKDKVMVATTGRVMVKVDASRHPIKIGDLLVTSSEFGVAMKSLPIRVGGRQIHRPGTIIGKALEPLSGGQGKILVLLSLQ